MLFTIFRTPSPTEVAARDLAEAERDYLANAKALEFHYAMDEMYARRISRLKSDLEELTNEQEQPRRQQEARQPQ